MNRALVILAAAAAMAIAAPAPAAPKARSSVECAVMGNMAFLAGSLARHGVDAARSAKIFADLYPRLYAERPDDAGEISRLVIAAAFRHARKYPKENAFVFGRYLEGMCVEKEGDVDEILVTGT